MSEEAGGMDESGAAAAPAPRRVLFVCTHNATRSPMAAALAGAMAPTPRVDAQSAGVYPSETVDPLAVAAMAELGIDIGGHRAHSMSDLEAEGDDLESYAAVIALTPAAAAAVEEMLPGAANRCELWATDDPTAGDGPDESRLQAYRRIRDALRERISARFAG